MFCPKCGAQNADEAKTCAACGAEMPQAQQPAQPTQMPMATALRTSPMAIWSLVLGILGFTCVAAIPGLILGIVSIRQINQKPRELAGKGLAIAGIVLSAVGMCCFALIATMSAILFPAFKQATEAAIRSTCQSNVRQLSNAAKMYLSDWNDTYPPAAQWSDALKPCVAAITTEYRSTYRCPAAPAKACGYALNEALGGQPEGVLMSPSETVQFFESDLGWNACGGAGAMITQPRHRAFTIGYADGHVMMVSPGSESGLRWTP